MKNTYPVILIKDEPGYLVYIPDFDINTEGDTITEAIEMARDAIGLIGIDMEDDGKALPVSSSLKDIQKKYQNDIVTLVDVDFTEYRKENDLKSVRRNVTLPSWLDYEASRSGLNVSLVLQEALKKELHLTVPDHTQKIANG